jgi:chromate transporter
MCITVASAGVMVFLGFQNIQLGVILVAALIGWFTTIIKLPVIEETGPIYRGRKAGYISLSIFTVLFFALPVLQQITGNQVIRIFASFYRTGALVFGGGHVVLPLLQESVVVPGWVTQDQFIAGYGLSQAIPGPLFTFSAYLGALMEHFTYPWVGGLLALFAIFLPSFLLVAGILPFWHRIRTKGRVQYSIAAINAAVVGLLLAALYDPIWVNTMVRIEDFLLGGIVMMVLTLFKCPVWFVVLLAAACGQLLTYL